MKIILFDGLCNLCNGSVQFIIKRDKLGVFKFVSLQSEIGQTLLRQFCFSNKETDSIVYIKEDKCFIQSSAVLNILKDLGGIWRLWFMFMVIPKFLRDFIYIVIAKTRYRIFGKRKDCLFLLENHSDRFLVDH